MISKSCVAILECLNTYKQIYKQLAKGIVANDLIFRSNI